MSTDLLTMKLFLETGEAEAALAKFSKKTSDEIIEETERATRQQLALVAQVSNQAAQKVSRLQQVWRGFSRSIQTASHAANVLRAGFDAASAAVRQMQAYLKFEDVQNVLKRMGFEPGTLNRISKALGDTVNKLQLASSVKLAADASLTAAEIQKAAQAAAFLAKQTGESKAQMFAMVTSGQLSAQALDKIGLSAQVLENSILKAGDGLTDLDKQAIKVRTVIQAAARASKNFSASTDQTQDAAQRLFARFQNLSQELARKAIPYLNKMLSIINKLLEDPQVVADTITSLVRSIGQFVAQIPKAIIKSIEGFKVFGVAVGKALSSGVKGGFGKIGEGFDSLLADLKTKIGKLAGQVRKEEFVAERGVKVAGDLNKKYANGNQLLRRKLGLQQQIAREALEELKARRAEARAMVRGLNFEFNALDLVSNLGGPVSGVISALKEAAEKTAVLGSQFPKAVEAAADFSVNLDKAKFATEGARKAAKLLRLALKGGALDLREYIGNEKSVNDQLRAGLSTLAGQQKILQAQIELRNQDKDVLASISAIKKAISLLSKRDNGANERLVSTLQKGLQQYRKIRDERARILSLQIATARIEKQSEIASKRLENKKGLLDARRLVADVAQGIAKLRGQLNPADEIRQQYTRRMQDVALTIQDLGRQAKELEQKLSLKGAFGGDAQSRQVAVERLNHLRQEVDLRQSALRLLAKQRQMELDGLSLGSQLVANMKSQLTGLQVWAQGIAQGINGTVQAVTSTMGQLFTDLVASPTKALDNLGKNILSAFGDLSLQLSAFFAAQSIGMAFTPGGQANAVGLGIAAAALAALGGSLKGVASSINAPKAPSTSSTGGSSGSPARQGLPGAQPREREQSNTYYLVTNSIYGSEESQARNLRDFVRRNQRSLGGRMF